MLFKKVQKFNFRGKVDTVFTLIRTFLNEFKLFD